MALNRVIDTKTGYEASYWTVSYFRLNKKEKTVNFRLKGYKDQESYESGAGGLDEFTSSYELDVDDPGIKPYNTLVINYYSAVEKSYNISLSNCIDPDEGIQANIKDLINQILTGCYIFSKKNIEDFESATDC